MCQHETNLKPTKETCPSEQTLAPCGAMRYFSAGAHAPQNCGRCQAPFECKVGNILECQCYGVSLSAEEKKFIADNYNDCLCRRCLEEIKTEFRQDAIDRKLQPINAFLKNR